MQVEITERQAHQILQALAELRFRYVLMADLLTPEERLDLTNQAYAMERMIIEGLTEDRRRAAH